VEVTLEIIGRKWKEVILYHLIERPYRFGELKRVMPGITQRMLTKQLRVQHVSLHRFEMINRCLSIHFIGVTRQTVRVILSIPDLIDISTAKSFVKNFIIFPTRSGR
jgi:hypothetical protein